MSRRERIENLEEDPQIEANASNIERETLDCGIVACRCCNSPACQKLGTTKSFLIVLISAGIIQSAVEAYFKIAVEQAAVELDYESKVVDWLLITNGISQGLFALIITYWANRIHRIAWLGGILMIQACTCFTLIIPTVSHNSEGSTNTLAEFQIEDLCLIHEAENLTSDKAYGVTTLFLLFMAQIVIGFGNVVLYTLGFSYLDDNLKEHESPWYLAAVLGTRFLGHEIGLAISMLVGVTPLGWWLGWVIISPIIFTFGLILALFPRHLLSSVVERAANDIINTVTNGRATAGRRTSKWLADISLYASLKRIFTNKILLFNLGAAVFVQTAIYNYFSYEHEYLQSRFYIPTSYSNGINDEWTSVLVTNFLRPPILALVVFIAGLIIAKLNPTARKLVMWNIFSDIKAIVIFVILIFINCQSEQVAGGGYRDKLTKPLCASTCVCSDSIPFTPICPKDSIFTYYSPCHAGCAEETMINNVKIYSNCSCGADPTIPITNWQASSGACNMKNCQKFWITFQVLSVVALVIISSCLVGKLIITIRSVLPQDKALALATELSLLGLIVYIPGNLSYQAIAIKTCQYWSSDHHQCFLHESPSFANALNITTACLILVGLIFEVLLFIYIKELPLYGEEHDENYRSSVQMIHISRLQVPENQNHEVFSQSQGLLQEEPQEVSVPPSSLVNNAVYTQVVRELPTRTISHDEDFQSAVDNEELNFQVRQPDNNSLILSESSSPSSRHRARTPETDF